MEEKDNELLNEINTQIEKNTKTNIWNWTKNDK